MNRPLTGGSLPPTHSVFGLHSPMLSRIVPGQFIENPLPRFTSDPLWYLTNFLILHLWYVGLGLISCCFSNNPLPLMSPLCDLPSIGPLTLLLGCESPRVLAGFRVEPSLSPLLWWHCKTWIKSSLPFSQVSEWVFLFFLIRYFSIYFICSAFCVFFF